jgi:hypothetical protein
MIRLLMLNNYSLPYYAHNKLQDRGLKFSESKNDNYYKYINKSSLNKSSKLNKKNTVRGSHSSLKFRVSTVRSKSETIGLAATPHGSSTQKANNIYKSKIPNFDILNEDVQELDIDLSNSSISDDETK